MRACLAVLCALAILAWPFVFAYVEAERLLGWSDNVDRRVHACVLALLIIVTWFVTFMVQQLLDLFGDFDRS